jgi:hypothetical protein
MGARVIRDLAELQALAARPDGVDVAIVLAGGPLRSSKHVRYLAPTGRYHRTGRFELFNEIDGTWQTLWPRQLWSRSHIGEALEKGALLLVG